MKISVKKRCFIYCYRLLFLPIFVVLLPYYLLRMWRRGGYISCFWHRLGFVPRNNALNAKTIWIQAVSVGEIEALQPLLEKLKTVGIRIYLTTTTSTGYYLAQKKYKNLTETIAYFPLDFCLFSWIAWRRIRPQYIFLMESELWPEHLWQAYRRGLPVFLLNGRCSDKTFLRYTRLKKFARTLFSFIYKIYAASELDAQRFQTLFSKPIKTVGNLKIDAALNQINKDASTLKLSDLGSEWENSLVLLGASTWPGEEKLLLEIFYEAKKLQSHLHLILVPRHVERIHEIAKLLAPHNFCLHTKPKLNADIYLVNTTGELKQFLKLAHFVFIGKSLNPHIGGQTPIEAAALGKAIVYGPHMENFKDICRNLETCGGSVRCDNEMGVQQQLMQWILNPMSAMPYAKSAQKWILSNQGVTQTILEDLKKEKII